MAKNETPQPAANMKGIDSIAVATLPTSRLVLRVRLVRFLSLCQNLGGNPTMRKPTRVLRHIVDTQFPVYAASGQEIPAPTQGTNRRRSIREGLHKDKVLRIRTRPVSGPFKTQ